jgi:4'-phosphopantetheinyl transferase
MSHNMNITDAGFRMPRVELAEDEVQLWRVDLEAICSHESRWQQLLSSDETIRAARFHFAADRQRFVASRAWLRTILAAFLIVEPSELNFCYSKNEKPFLGPSHAKSGITFNVSHSGGIGLYAFARRRDIGVDVEQIRRDFDGESIAHRFFSASEQKQLASLLPLLDPEGGLCQGNRRRFVASSQPVRRVP